jgi:hypothetical protein
MMHTQQGRIADFQLVLPELLQSKHLSALIQQTLFRETSNLSERLAQVSAVLVCFALELGVGISVAA